MVYQKKKKRYRHNDARQNSKVMALSPDSDTDFFDIVTVVLQLASFFFIVCLDYVSTNVNKFNGRKWFHAQGKKQKL